MSNGYRSLTITGLAA